MYKQLIITKKLPTASMTKSDLSVVTTLYKWLPKKNTLEKPAGNSLESGGATFSIKCESFSIT